MVRVVKLILASLMLLSAAACIKMPQYRPGSSQTEEDTHPEPEVEPQLLSLSFKKEFNPQLLQDIDCFDTRVDHLLIVMDAGVDLPCYLHPSYDVVGGGLEYCGDVLQNNVDSIYVSETYPALLRIRGSQKTKTYSLSCVKKQGLPIAGINMEENLSSKWKQAVIRIYGNGLFPDSRLDTIDIKLRGHSTSRLSKKPFNIKYRSKNALLGMPKNRKWSFLANYRDKTLMRNSVASRLSELCDNIAWTPRSQFVDVLLNGERMGCYTITESIKRGKDRVNIDEGGFILEVDEHFDEDNKFRSALENWPVNLKYPGPDVIKDNQLLEMENYFNDFEYSLLTQDYLSVRDLVDYPSFADVFIVIQLAGSAEYMAGGSVYLYKNSSGKLFAGPVWDFEQKSFSRTDTFKATDALWYKYLTKDPVFVALVKERWAALRPVFYGDIFPYIDSLSSVIARSARINDSIFPISDLNFDNGDESLPFEEAIAKLKNTLDARFAYSDAIIAAL